MLKTTIKAGVILIALLSHSVANAIAIRDIPDGSSNTILLVQYTQGTINYGPLSFGLPALPTEVSAQFTLGPVAEDPLTGTLQYEAADIMSSSVLFGDAAWTALASFELKVVRGIVESLSYEFSPILSNAHTGGIALNFPLSITGLDTTSNTEFKYTYSASTQSFRSINVPEPTSLILFGLGLAGLVFAQRRKA